MTRRILERDFLIRLSDISYSRRCESPCVLFSNLSQQISLNNDEIVLNQQIVCLCTCAVLS